MITPKYSYLIAENEIEIERIETLLSNGIKVICFSSDAIVERLGDKDWKYYDYPYLEVYKNYNNYRLQIIDGKYTEKEYEILLRLAENNESFNLEQYLVEHAKIDSNLCIEAGAGTGKTHVMVNRIMYLFHIDEKFSFEKVAMITFTNKATDNMRHRLIKEMKIRYELTGNQRYLIGLEQVTQVTICTIHAYFKKLIIEIGPLLGYGTNLQMRSYVQEKHEILKNLMDKSFGNKKISVKEEFGLSMYDIESLAFSYWDKMDNIGLNEDEVKELSWGKAGDKEAKKIQKQLEIIFSQIEDIYNYRKLMDNAISMKDIIHELGRVIHHPEVKEYIATKFDYIFCDEFQDSDAVQIKTIALLNQIYGSSLFVVGDIKQSIYRFRGATDAAFQKLTERAKEIEFDTYSLKKNYRTAPNLMKSINKIFLDWDRKKYIQYSKQTDELVPQKKTQGIYKQIPVTKRTRKDKVMSVIKKIFEVDKQSVVTILTRTNKELETIKKWCDEEKIPVNIKERGGFFKSPAVLDFIALVEGLLYDGEPMYLWELVKSSYVGMNIDYHQVTAYQGKKYKLLCYFDDIFSSLNWKKYKDELVEKPVLSVIREIIEERKPVDQYLKIRISELYTDEIELDTLSCQVLLDVQSYSNNLNKLLQMLQDKFGNEFCSLYDICSYLRIRILTDDVEELEDSTNEKDGGYVQGYTVHGAKGLEFDHVLIPFMTNPFVSDFRSEVLISEDNSKIGWIYRKNEKEISNDNYGIMKVHEEKELLRDETRLLYVAMTRAISSLYVFPTRTWDENRTINWSGLVPKEKDDA